MQFWINFHGEIIKETLIDFSTKYAKTTFIFYDFGIIRIVLGL